MREQPNIHRKVKVTRLDRGRYIMTDWIEQWEVRRSPVSGRWYGESKDRPGKMIDAKTLSCAKYDFLHHYFVNCASAGI